MKIQKILIANRGEIAVRIIKTLQKMKLASVIVYHSVDSESPAVKIADEGIELTGDQPVAAYLDAEQIIQACKKTGADAVHPGFGFLSENATFANRLAEEGITFIGPSAEVINLMGNKVQARAFCIEHGFPIAESVVDEGNEDEFITKAKAIGVPLLIKAAAGGGGKGMQIVRDASKIEESIALARGEALRSFGDSLVYAERFVDTPRHIEVQVLADKHGNVIHLGERECSIQRRFQKVIEEAPSATLTAEQRERICGIAAKITATSNYENAGTIEFIYAPSGEFYFLEMNTRVQVEHPVTEMITGIDIIEQQIRIAEGETLSMKQSDIALKGHAIEVRLYAEDPDNDFAPSIGPLLRYKLPHELARIEDGFYEGQSVTSAFDPMLSKIIVHGESRTEAINKMLLALNETSVMGVTTNRDFLIRILKHPEFSAGETHTGFIKTHENDLKREVISQDEHLMLLGAVAMLSAEFNNKNAEISEPHISIGAWRNL